MQVGTEIQSTRNINHAYLQKVEFSPEPFANIVCHDDMAQAYHLRHRVFAEELGWVPRCESGLEMDAYDSHAEHFGVFRAGRLLSYLRLVMPSHRFMIEKEFAGLVSMDHRIRKESDTCEVSRLCVRSDERATKVHTGIGPMNLSMLLYRRVYQWCAGFGVRFLYLVVEHKIFRLLSMLGFPCSLVGEPTKMPDGVVAVAAMMDWREFEDRNALKRPQLIEWFNRSQASPDGLPRRLPEAGLQPQAFS